MSAPDPSDPVAVSVDVYTASADAYEATYASRYGAIVARFAASLPAGSLVLDAGCGPGRDLARFVAHGHGASGFYLNPAFVAKARRHSPTTLGDLRTIAAHYPAGSFDGVWASASLVHLPAEVTAAVLAQFATLLRPGGRLFVSVRSTGETGWLDEPDGRRWYSVWTADAIAAAVVTAGFAVDDVDPGPYTELWGSRPVNG